MNSFFEMILDLLFPSACIICNKDGLDICKNCLGHFKIHKPQNYPWTISLWDYHDENVEKVMRHIKNHPNSRVTNIIAQQLHIKLRHAVLSNVEFQNLKNVVIISIPIGRARFRVRGYNQSLLLARPLAKLLKRKIIDDALVKSRNTKKQGTTKNKAERLQNLKNSFAVKSPAKIKNRDIIIVDDITTTGSTLVEARETLLAAGAKHVVAITVAN